VVAIELKFGIHQSLVASFGLDGAEQRHADTMAFPLMLVFSSVIGASLSNLSLRDVIIYQGLVVILTSLWR
jgi:hypothetical protein